MNELRIADCRLRIEKSIQSLQIEILNFTMRNCGSIYRTGGVIGRMTPEELKRWTKTFALQAIKLVEALPHTRTADIIGKQLMRCATSVGANYRAACRAKSRADFVAKMGIVEEEADESIYWLELLADTGLVPMATFTNALNDANQILAIVVTSLRTAKGNQERPAIHQQGQCRINESSNQ